MVASAPRATSRGADDFPWGTCERTEPHAIPTGMREEAGQDGERETGEPYELRMHRVIELRVRMHESGTSAVVSFQDEAGRPHRVSLVARAGGGALTSGVPKRYEAALQALGLELWPRGAAAQRPSGVYATGAGLGTTDIDAEEAGPRARAGDRR
jgi:hypothetical protein